MLHARVWTEDNPTAWAYIEREALGKAHSGQRFGMHGLCDRVRNGDFPDNDGKPPAVNNNLTPALARIPVGRHPEVCPFVELMNSACDGDGNPRRPYDAR